MKLISLFNHKGGVSKTTTTFNLGWMLADLGHKTLIVDADPQCNLTAIVLDYKSIEDIEEFYQHNSQCDIFTGVEPVLSGTQEKISAAKPIQTSNRNLYLLAGNIKLAEAETQISVAVTTSRAIPALQNIPGSFRELLHKTALEKKFDFVLIDMSPSVGALNEILLMTSDFFVVPTSPDFFCAQAIISLSSVLPRWNDEIKKFRDENLTYPMPDTPPKFLGIISQKYRPRSGSPAKSFQKWIDSIKKTVDSHLIPTLVPHEMTISKEKFKNHVDADSPYNLANIADFNSLIAQSQKFNVPIFALSDEQIEQGGVILGNMKESQKKFKDVFKCLAESIEKLTDEG